MLAFLYHGEKLYELLFARDEIRTVIARPHDDDEVQGNAIIVPAFGDHGADLAFGFDSGNRSAVSFPDGDANMGLFHVASLVVNREAAAFYGSSFLDDPVKIRMFPDSVFPFHARKSLRR